MMQKPLIIAEQSANPTGLLGWIVAKVMARDTAFENDAAIKLLDIRAKDRVLDFGCGHGRSLGILCDKAADSLIVVGADQSDTMLREAKARNKKLVRDGRLALKKLSSSSKLPFENSTFDKILSIHTIYFLNSLQDTLAEFKRILTPQGICVIGFVASEDVTNKSNHPEEVYNMRSTKDVLYKLDASGFRILKMSKVSRNNRVTTLLKVGNDCAL